ncbi:UDP-N-acetylmuramoyl-L-alanyl-D-glutamate--2,6-diaminopimelate ligase [Hydrogenophaga crassostreae]|uniref:UDP-N-acetylmuramoyl-L-alanyl-D-glutamate--2,6-diaminopimelate ligase n=1 Tax=Hydrogenophaga crassostreae TaxID=1763535 RepID=A0A167HN67_9BURK|nr:UDP-N-acetylmuramoyl-L-alanyl-D-glutamate--2,6-diaminopimelate ligase [Hydrogenophaga crassostreae]AOW14917.1 UDP-N-acetylmuramoyl-L-alanyl-D-glutamate--2,6-diaminopimelate ligase [Hydrogenophaga crassostreae]OAD41484.1 UDP-N-acetylmuramoyl-L-alanyl-D-glutamate--2,6-diaminopimelate ligase [Hydrogenophaga crassostreae]
MPPAAIANWLRQRVTGRLLCDSRQLGAGDGFVAWPGAATDGRKFVRDALSAGALAAVVEREGVEAFDLVDDRVLMVSDLKAQAGAIASAYFADPSASLAMVAITGTNGKTSTAWWIAQLLGAAKKPCGLVGTLGIGHPPLAGHDHPPLVPTGLTTPDPVLLQERLSGMVADGTVACAIEASSIGLGEGRLNATHIRVAVFTNFTQDHLDFHGSMAAYWAAKAALFDWAGLAAAVINLDDPKGAELVEHLASRRLDLWTVAVGENAKARLKAQALSHTKDGVRFDVVECDLNGVFVARESLNLPLVGVYNVSNVLCALASARAMQVPLPVAVAACAQLTPVPGRMERAGNAADDEPLVLVDYAHTPDALEKALQALQPITAERGGELWVVVGCGGDRDTSKRPLMAAVAERTATRVVLTSDNPRSEDPPHILEQMAEGLKQPGAALMEVDRAVAIRLAVAQAKVNDVVLIAGKGHEDYQETQGVKRPFSDTAQARDALVQRRIAAGVVV